MCFTYIIIRQYIFSIILSFRLKWNLEHSSVTSEFPTLIKEKQLLCVVRSSPLRHGYDGKWQQVLRDWNPCCSLYSASALTRVSSSDKICLTAFFSARSPAWSQEMQFVAHFELNFCWKCCMEQLTHKVKMRGYLYRLIQFYYNNQNNLEAGWREITRN